MAKSKKSFYVFAKNLCSLTKNKYPYALKQTKYLRNKNFRFIDMELKLSEEERTLMLKVLKDIKSKYEYDFDNSLYNYEKLHSLVAKTHFVSVIISRLKRKKIDIRKGTK